MRRFAAMAAAAALALAGCGGDDDEPATGGGDSTPAMTETAESAPTATETAEAGGATTLAIEADPSGENAFTETELTATAGEVTIEFSNPASVPHAVVIEGVDDAGTETVTGEDAPPVTVQLEPGEYTYFCPVGNHRDDGMEGTLIVE